MSKNKNRPILAKKSKPFVQRKKAPLTAFAAASSVDAKSLEKNENDLNDTFDLPSGCRWNSNTVNQLLLRAQKPKQKDEAIPERHTAPPPAGIGQRPVTKQSRPMGVKQSLIPAPPIQPGQPMTTAFPNKQQPIREFLFTNRIAPPGLRPLQTRPAAKVKNIECQTDLDAETELFEMIVFDADLLDLILHRFPEALNIICKLVMSPTAVAEERIIDANNAHCGFDHNYANEKWTQSAKTPHKDLVFQLLANAEIFDLIVKKNGDLAFRLDSD